MYYVYIVNKVLLILLGASTGLVKIFKMEAEMKIFRNAGFNDLAIIAFGIVQLLATILILFPQSLKIGGVLLAVTFLIATGVLFKNEMIPFGIFSILFIAMAIFVCFPQ
jgi:hypothetical protein